MYNAKNKIVLILLLACKILINTFYIKHHYNKKNNSMLIVMDQHVAWHRLPPELLLKLKGYQAFKKIGIEFTSIYNNKQACSASRASFLTSVINNGIQDNIDQAYQYNTVPRMQPPPIHDNIGIMYKRNNYDITGYFGKSHVDSKLDINDFTIPLYVNNTRGAMKEYGFDVFNQYGDTYYVNGVGMIGDMQAFKTLLPNNACEYDYKDTDGNKWTGLMPFIQARKKDKKSFHVQYHITNPHDTQHFWQNRNEIPKQSQIEFWTPFLRKQINFEDDKNQYIFNKDFKDAYIKSKNLTSNYFEDNYNLYTTCKKLLPFKKSFNYDYASNPTNNSIVPLYVASSLGFTNAFTFPYDEHDIASWKNLINNYYGLIIEADNYIFEIYKYLEKNKLLKTTSVVIMSDHGDLMSAHGLKQKFFPFNECTNVPFIVYSPNIHKKYKNTICDNIGSLIDLAPTLETLSEFKHKSNKFIGSSLFKQDEHNLLHPINNDLPVIHIITSIMFLTTYFYYPSWISKQSDDVKNRILNNPASIFNYQAFYTMIVTRKNNKKYKFVRYFSLFELITYNIKYSKLVYNINKLQTIFDNFKNNNTFINSDITKFINNSLLLQEKFDVIKQVILDNFNNDDFDFIDAYNILVSHTSNNSYVVYLFITLIIINYSELFNNMFYLPGVFSSYNDIKNNDNYLFACYNLTDDNNEVCNLADPNFSERNDINLFNHLNKEMNKQICSKHMNKYFIILPAQFFNVVLNILEKFGENISEYTPLQQYIANTLFGLNNNDDSHMDKQKITNLLAQDNN